MGEQWVLNASPLIVLAQINQIDLVPALADAVVVPGDVVSEIEAGPPDDPARLYLETGDLSVVEAPPPTAELLAWDLGRGETAVLSYARHHPNWTAIIDDKAARKCARSFSVRVKGTLGVIILARQRGLIPSATELLRELRRNGFRLDDRLIRETLRRTVGEAW